MISGELAAPAEPERLKVRPGQTLSGIAHEHHVPMRVIAEANRLFPPYRIEAGSTLIIPRAGQPSASPPSPLTAAALPPAPAASPPAPPAAAASTRIEPTALDRLPPPSTSVEPPATAVPPPVAAGPRPAPEPARLESKPAASSPASYAAATPEPPAAAAAPTPPVQSGGTLQWPVRGNVLSGYGSGRDGTHNDGINIAAPRGAAVEAADGGTVAYTGNELRGYGNLILVKHPNGWISAYAHCDLILVKRGDKVARGQVIARVGSTGNVSEPQLHFELRRGNKAVDPREFLAPLPNAGSDKSSRPS
jgi:murein DD-endopeptidase MepM/ murein hydrolase activator NlpD